MKKGPCPTLSGSWLRDPPKINKRERCGRQQRQISTQRAPGNNCFVFIQPYPGSLKTRGDRFPGQEKVQMGEKIHQINLNQGLTVSQLHPQFTLHYTSP